MGCDIHMIAEKQSRYDDDKDGWVPLLTPLFKNKHYRSAEKLSDFNCPYSFQPWDDRHYELFSVLANVRNGYNIEPISTPRGYPMDMHDVSQWLLDGFDYAEHSRTWLSLEEVLAYNWSKAESTYVPGGTLAKSCGEFLRNMELLKQYGEDENCDIRLVFGFDS